jgi:hypothetical protein
MQTPTTQSLLAAWELGRAEPHLIERGLLLLLAAYPGSPRPTLAQLSIGERDSLLLGLREQAFGSGLTALAECHQCGARLEFQLRVADLCVPRESPALETLTLSVGDYELEFRLPNSFDLSAVRETTDLDDKKQRLLERLVSRARHCGLEIGTKELPEEVIAAMEDRMEKADPQAVVQLSVHCECCGHEWKTGFDIASFLWTEVDSWAIRILREVHSLARAYSWSETDILAMSPWRRQCYLEMLGA